MLNWLILFDQNQKVIFVFFQHASCIEMWIFNQPIETQPFIWNNGTEMNLRKAAKSVQLVSTSEYLNVQDH